MAGAGPHTQLLFSFSFLFETGSHRVVLGSLELM